MCGSNWKRKNYYENTTDEISSVIREMEDNDNVDVWSIGHTVYADGLDNDETLDVMSEIDQRLKAVREARQARQDAERFREITAGVTLVAPSSVAV